MTIVRELLMLAQADRPYLPSWHSDVLWYRTFRATLQSHITQQSEGGHRRRGHLASMERACFHTVERSPRPFSKKQLHGYLVVDFPTISNI